MPQGRSKTWKVECGVSKSHPAVGVGKPWQFAFSGNVVVHCFFVVIITGVLLLLLFFYWCSFFNGLFVWDLSFTRLSFAPPEMKYLARSGHACGCSVNSWCLSHCRWPGGRWWAHQGCWVQVWWWDVRPLLVASRIHSWSWGVTEFPQFQECDLCTALRIFWLKR